MTATLERNHLDDDLTNILEARKELSGDEERHLVESFLNRLDREIDSRVETRLSAIAPATQGSFPWPAAAVLIVAIVLAAPIVGAAGFYAGTAGVIMALAALVFVAAVVSLTARQTR